MASKRKKYLHHKAASKKFKGTGMPELSAGMKGVLITTNDKEKFCVMEAYNLLNEYADQLYGPEMKNGSDSGDDDVEEKLMQEISSVKSSHKTRFKAALTGVKNVIFIQFESSLDPCHLIHHMLCDIQSSKTQKTRFCLRMIPVTAVCYASQSEIKKCAASVISPYFHKDPSSSIEFSVHYKARNNHTIKRDTVVDLLASIVTDNGGYHHTVNLKNPKLVVCIEIVKNMCCLTVLHDFYQLKQYNVTAISETFLTTEESGLLTAGNPLIDASAMSLPKPVSTDKVLTPPIVNEKKDETSNKSEADVSNDET